MISLLQEHIKKYPLMEIRDVAKLLYQSEFGGGHMIADPEMSLKRIQEEFQSLNQNAMVDQPVLEPIGNGMCRIYLNCLSNGMKIEVLNQIFVQSANNKKGSIDGLENKIAVVLAACENGTLPFSRDAFIEFCAIWKEKGYPAISHSEVYRKNYHPAYRVVESSFADIYEVIHKIEAREKESFVVAIDGMCGSGKSTMAELLKINYPQANLFHVDDYFLQSHQRTPERLAEVGGNVDYERFKEEIVDNLTNKNGVKYRKFSCRNQRLGEEMEAAWQPITIIEGAYSHHPYFGNAYDLRVFCEISEEEQLSRILKRNGTEMLRRFQNEWIPKENQYFKEYKIREKSGLLL